MVHNFNKALLAYCKINIGFNPSKNMVKYFNGIKYYFGGSSYNKIGFDDLKIRYKKAGYSYRYVKLKDIYVFWLHKN